MSNLSISQHNAKVIALLPDAEAVKTYIAELPEGMKNEVRSAARTYYRAKQRAKNEQKV